MRGANKLRPIAIVVVFLLSHGSWAQRQLLVRSGDRVLHHFKAGDTFRTKLKGDSRERWGFLVEVNEFSVITSQDTIELANIKKVLLPGKPLVNKIGKTLILVGTLYFVIDQFNNSVVQGNDLSMDKDVWKPSLIFVSAGIPLLFFKRNWRDISKGNRLTSIGRDSRFYMPE